MSLLAERWALRVALSNGNRAGRLRTVHGTEAAIVGDDLWFRGVRLDDELLPTLAAVADGPVFMLSGDDWLTPVRHRVPSARLPDADFTAAENLLTPTLPTSQLAYNFQHPVKLKLQRSSTAHVAELWCGVASEFRKWAETAPKIRLQACRYALCSDSGRVIVRGIPLPPLAGQLFWMADRIAIPLGWHWSPAVDTAALNDVILSAAKDSHGVTDSTIVVWHPATAQNSADYTEPIAGTSFIPVSRSSVRNIRC